MGNLGFNYFGGARQSINSVNQIPNLPSVQNEPVLDYRPKSSETALLKAELSRQLKEKVDIPIFINGREVRTGRTAEVVAPHRHGHVLGAFHQVGVAEVEQALDGALKAQPSWSRTPWTERAAIFLKAAELLSTRYRYQINAATMLGQSKTCHQAELDSACELIDFLRFNVAFAEQIYKIQPLSAKGQWNQIDYRALEGFVFAVTPFNFTAIAGNLPTSAALMGNVVLWKPASTAVLSAHVFLNVLREAGLPPGVIQFLPGSGSLIGEKVLKHPALAGIHFTGSTPVFNALWQSTGQNLNLYRNYPRLVGETGGKDFVLAHESAIPDVVITALIRGAYEYQGQKCSAASRAYIPRKLWHQIQEPLISQIRSIPVGDVTDFKNFMGAVIDNKSYENTLGYIHLAMEKPGLKTLAGGKGNKETGYFIEPTLLLTEDPKSLTMCEEIFGPVLTVYVYDENQFDSILKLIDETSPYGLTGAILSQDREVTLKAMDALRYSAGNLYLNNKPTGAVVGQQPFGGSRSSGTNDKSGSFFNLIRWTSLRTVCDTLNPPQKYSYPFMEEG